LCVYISHTLKRDIHTGVTAALAADGYTEVVCISLNPLPFPPPIRGHRIQEVLARRRLREHHRCRGCMTKRVWRGRLRDRVWKAFVALAGQDVPTTDLIQRTWPRKSKWHPEEYRRVLADPVARGSGRGWPWLWRLRGL
jgi:hypothetical protein